MKAAVVTAFKKPLEIKQVEIPKPGPNDVLVKNIACGVCHTDLHTANGGKEKQKANRIRLKLSFLKIGMLNLNCHVFPVMKVLVKSLN